MVNSESRLLGNLVKIRFTGVPVAQAIKSIAIENSEIKVKDLHQEAENQFNLNPLLNYKYIYKGKVLSDFTKIAELNLNPSDVITVMGEQAGASPYMRQEALEQFIKDGLDKNEIIKILTAELKSREASKDYLENSLQYYYGENSLEIVKNELLKNQFENYLDLCYSEEKILSSLENDGFNFIQGTKNQKRAQVSQYFENLYGKSYKQLIFERSRTKFYSAALLDRLSYHKVWENDDKFWNTVKLDGWQLFGIIEPNIVFNKDGKIIDNVPIWIEQGYQHPTDKHKGKGLEHIMNTHGDEFFDWGYRTAKDVAEFLLKTIKEQVPKYDNKRGYNVYKININGITQYLGISISNYGFIVSAGKFNQRDGDILFSKDNFIGKK